MIIDVHGHSTTAPAQLQAFRDAQLAHLDDPSGRARQLAPISDDELRESVESKQLRVLDERGIGVMLISRNASGIEHHVADPVTAVAWARVCAG